MANRVAHARTPPAAFTSGTRRIEWGVDRGGSILTGAPSNVAPVAYWDTRNYSGSGSLLNQGTGGSALDLALPGGTNNPLWLAYAGEKYASLPGIAANRASTPDSGAVSITGDIDLIMRIAADDWTPSSDRTLQAKMASSNICWRIMLLTTGALQFTTSADGSTAITRNSTEALPASDGVTYWIRVTLDVDNGAAGNDVNFYYAADSATVPTSWTQLGTTVTTAGATSIFNGTNDLWIGQDQYGGALIAGKVYRALFKNGIGGTLVADYDPSRSVEPHSTFTASTGEVWTHSRAATGRKLAVVDRNMFLFGTDDYLSVADDALLDFALADSGTWVWAGRIHGTAGYAGAYMSKSAAGVGYRMAVGSSGRNQLLVFGDGASGYQLEGSGEGSAGTSRVHSTIRDTAADKFRLYENATARTGLSTDTNTATSENASSFYIAKDSEGGYSHFEFFGAAVFRRALTAAEIAQVVREMGVVA